MAAVVSKKFQPFQKRVKSDIAEEECKEVSDRILGNPPGVLSNFIIGEVVHDSRKAGTSQCDPAEPGRVNVPDNISVKRPIDQGVDTDALLQG